MSTALFVWLRAIRLLCLISLLNFCLLTGGLVYRTWSESDRNLSSTDVQEGYPLSDCSTPPTTEGGCPPSMGITIPLLPPGQEDNSANAFSENSLSTFPDQSQLRRLQDHGFEWVRIQMDWSQLEPESGRYEWEKADIWLTAISRAKLEPVVVLTNSPDWARRELDRSELHPFPAPPEHHSDMARFAHHFSTRYGQQVSVYQIWDEPNIWPNWGARHIEPVDYARLLKTVGGTIRRADGDAFILAGALAPTADRGHTAIDEIHYLNRLYSADQGFQLGHSPDRLFDGVAIQPFGFAHTPDYPRRNRAILNFQRAALVRQTMVVANDEDTPLWASRFGWSRGSSPDWPRVSPQIQVDFAQQATQIASTEWPWLTHMGWPTGMFDDVRKPSSVSSDPSTSSTGTSSTSGNRKDNPKSNESRVDGSLLEGFTLTPPLVQALTKDAGENHTQARQGLSLWASIWASIWGSYTAQPLWASFILLVIAGLLIGWRGWVTLNQLGLVRYAQKTFSEVGWLFVVGLLFLAFVYHTVVWPPLLLLCWLALVLFFWISPSTGLLVAVLLLPFHFQHKEITLIQWTVQIAPAHAAALALLPGLLRYNWVHHRWDHQTGVYYWNRLSGWDWLAFGWVLLGLISVQSSWHPTAYVSGLLDLVFIPILLYGATRLLSREFLTRKQLLGALFVGGIFVAAIGLISWLQGRGTEADGFRRLVGTHFSPNHTALYLERTLFIGLGLFSCWWTRRRFSLNGFSLSSSWLERLEMSLLGVGLLLTALALLLTASRGALLLGIPMGLLLWSLVWLRSQAGWFTSDHRPTTARSLFYSPLLWLLVLICLLLLLMGIWFFWERLSNSATVYQRLIIWQASLKLWRDYPLFGIGPGGYFWHYPAYTLSNPILDPNLRHPHNLWLETGTMMGLAGILWLNGYLFQLWRTWQQVASRIRNEGQIEWLSIMLMAGIMAGLAHGQVDAVWSLADLAAINWVMVGLLPQIYSGSA
ncbi:MAG: O-antigen ligase family protein [Chloroflexota bacterium]